MTNFGRKLTSFFLHREGNGRFHPCSKYPLTNFVDRQTLNQRSLQRIVLYRCAKNVFLLFLLIIVVSFPFRIHIYLYNRCFGPFHLNLEQFKEQVQIFRQGQSFLWAKEYFQIEFGEDQIYNPRETIRRFSKAWKRDKHIATYKKVRDPFLYVKLPTRQTTFFHRQYPFHFRLYSIKTLKCVVRQLQQTNENRVWTEKSEYLQFINKEYGENATRFNLLVLTKCGLLIGYLYKPHYEIAFLSHEEYRFTSNDIALETTLAYFPWYLFYSYSLITIGLLIVGFSYFCLYLLNLIRVRFGRRYSIFSYPLKISPDLVEELWLLNSDESIDQQLIDFDRFLEESEYQFANQLFVIENDFQQLFVVLFQRNLDELLNLVDEENSPMILCPVTDLKRITRDRGICYGKDFSWINWPLNVLQHSDNCAEWLHGILIDKSSHYRQQYEDRLQNEGTSSPSILVNPQGFFHSNERLMIGSSQREQRQRRVEDHFSRFLREEENFQRLKRERIGLFEFLFERSISASPRFIAQFREEQFTNPTSCDSILNEQTIQCTMCLELITLNQPYAQWPCPSTIPHIFHFDCMLNLLRTQNTCPLCRYPVEPSSFSPSTTNFTEYFRGFL